MQKKRGEREKSVRQNNRGPTTKEERGNYHAIRQREKSFIEREEASEKKRNISMTSEKDVQKENTYPGNYCKKKTKCNIQVRK
jgi:hypothetical protein